MSKFLALLVLLPYVSFAQQLNKVVPFDVNLSQFLNVRDFTISQNGKEAYFTIQSPGQNISQIAYIKKDKKGWLKPELALFCDSFMYLEPFLSNNGNRLFFVSDRPLASNDTKRKDFDIWYVDRADESDHWSEPINMGSPVNSPMDEFYPSLADNNNLYFTMASPKGLGKDDIYVSKWNGDKYGLPEILDKNINSAGYEFNAYISKKEDFLLFTKYNDADGFGSGDLYIAKKNAEGQWQKATNLGLGINTKFMEYCPFYDEKNGILYFTSRRNNLIPRKFKDITAFQKFVYENENGLSKIYKTTLPIEF